MFFLNFGRWMPVFRRLFRGSLPARVPLPCGDTPILRHPRFFVKRQAPFFIRKYPEQPPSAFMHPSPCAESCAAHIANALELDAF